MCTLGKHTCTLRSLIKLLNAGMNVARISMAGLRNEIENQQDCTECWDWNSPPEEDIFYDQANTKSY
jgi:hypothetical protein